MPRSLYLTIEYDPRDIFRSKHPVPKDATAPMSELTRFHYYGPPTFLNDFMSELSAPSLQDALFSLCTKTPPLYLPHVIDDVREEFRSVSITFDSGYFHLLSWSHSGKSITSSRHPSSLGSDWVVPRTQ